jgi:hypothetical protein
MGVSHGGFEVARQASNQPHRIANWVPAFARMSGVHLRQPLPAALRAAGAVWIVHEPHEPHERGKRRGVARRASFVVEAFGAARRGSGGAVHPGT